MRSLLSRYRRWLAGRMIATYIYISDGQDSIELHNVSVKEAELLIADWRKMRDATHQ